MAVLGYLAKLKRDLGLRFGAHFHHHFSTKMFLTEYSINMDKKFQCHTLFFSQDIKQNVFSCFYLDR